MRKVTKLWTTKTGERIRICDMTDSHLLNSIRMLRRNAERELHFATEAIGAASCSFTGEMASYYAEQDFDRILETTPEDWLDENCEIYFNLIDEADRRGLEWEEEKGETK